jgi:hypothetical protein
VTTTTPPTPARPTVAGTNRPDPTACAGLLLVQTARAVHDRNGNPRRAMVVSEVAGTYARRVDVVCWSYGEPEAPAGAVQLGDVDVDMDEWRRLEVQHADHHAPYEVWYVAAPGSRNRTVVIGRRWSASAAAKCGRDRAALLGGTYAVRYRGELTGPGRHDVAALLDAWSDVAAIDTEAVAR